MTVIEPYGVRIGWADLPAPVRGWVAEVLGGPVEEAVSQRGGFSPGTADRVATAAGRRAFVKAVSPAQNPDTPGLLRRELRVLRSMPDHVVAPQLLAARDDGEWVVLVLEDIEGRHPRTPWVDAQVRAVIASLAELSDHPAPESWPGLEVELSGEYASWARIETDPPEDLDPWARGQLAELDRLAREALEHLAGGAICHSDIRSDNLLVQPDGQVRIVDWPWASRGPAWFDAVSLLVNVRLYGGLDVAPYLPLVRALGASEEDVTGTLAGLGGFLVEAAAKPAVPGLLTLRAFQRVQGAATLDLLRERLDH